MKRISLQWRITLMTVLLIGVTCVAMNLLLCFSGVYYMDTIVDGLQGGGTVILNEEGTASFDPQLVAPDDELTIVVDGAQGRFRATNWYITAAVTLLSGILAYFVSGRALKPLRSFASQVEMVQMNNLADMKIDEDVLPEFKQLSHSFNQMLERLNTAFAAQRQFTGNAAQELRTPLEIRMFGTRKLGRTSDQRKAMLRQLTTDLLENGKLETTFCRAKEVQPVAEKMITLGKKGDLAAYRQALAFITKEDVAHKVFKELAPKYADRNGGYTRVTRIGVRRGDAAEMAIIELV